MTGDYQNTSAFIAEGLSCTRGGRQLFSGISFNLKPGQGLIVTGPNGSGKTSLLRILTGFLEADEGKVSWQGETQSKALPLTQGTTHYLGHQSGLKLPLSVSENLSLWQKLNGAAGDFNKALKQVGLDDLADIPCRFLSEGQKKRVNLARFMAQPLPLWIMDEPAAALDDAGLEILKKVILMHLKKGGVFIGATHQDLGLEGFKRLNLGEKS